MITGSNPAGERILLGFADAGLGRDVPAAVGTSYCDAAGLMMMLAGTGAVELVLRSRHGEARLPRLAAGTLGGQFPNDRLRLAPATGPDAQALHEALTRRVSGFPAVCAAWLSLAHWPDSPEPQLLLHVAVNEDPPGPVANHLLRALLREEALRHLSYPEVAVVPLHPVAHAHTIAELDDLGLATVRNDARPDPFETTALGVPRPCRRWFRRS
ncbi:hypothetical protein P3T36_007666 [Kitasatospora sp. MAP12-15]|uniref:hypothetical protein n=1 Tax=unclassified Kitasatospora TaxID=2633591 RepID=UPI0024741294|nr:hypothetical protein [Kitasatospora sp. MAP12-44]MDH6115690.1 hypothetical protein [Kitasatospora sp. MAP12-44]